MAPQPRAKRRTRETQSSSKPQASAADIPAGSSLEGELMTNPIEGEPDVHTRYKALETLFATLDVSNGYLVLDRRCDEYLRDLATDVEIRQVPAILQHELTAGIQQRIAKLTIRDKGLIVIGALLRYHLQLGGSVQFGKKVQRLVTMGNILEHVDKLNSGSRPEMTTSMELVMKNSSMMMVQGTAYAVGRPDLAYDDPWWSKGRRRHCEEMVTSALADLRGE